MLEAFDCDSSALGSLRKQYSNNEEELYFGFYDDLFDCMNFTSLCLCEN